MTEGIDGPLAVAFLVMVLLGYFSVVLVSRGAISNKLAWALSPAFGTGICSIIFFFFRRPVFTAEFALLGVMFAMWVRYRQRTISKTASPAGMPILAALMIGALAWVTFGTLISIDRSPHGGWDGFAIWNSHARYLYRAGPVWQHYIRNTAHPDYPLLLPAATARLWRYIGKDAPDAPGVQNLLLAISGVTILAATLWELQRGSLSFLLPLLLVGTPFYLTLAVWQYADVPLSVYILATLGLICVHWQREQDRARLLVLAGFTAGCAAWTKNEGLLFVLVTSVLLFLPIFWNRAKTLQRLAMFSLGLLVPLAVTFYFKFAVPWPSDIVQNRAYPELMSKITDVHRYTMIVTAFLKTSGSFGRWAIHPAIPLIALFAVWGVNRRVVRDGGWITSAAALAVMLSGYFAVYVITALPLDVHLATSLDRLLMQLWPSLLLVAGLAVDRTGPFLRCTTPTGVFGNPTHP